MTMKKSRKRKRRKRGLSPFLVKFFPFEIGVEVLPGTVLLDAIKKADLPLRATCGGKGTCGECVVRILSGKFQAKPAASLRKELASQNYSLSCQTKVMDNLEVQVPRFQEISFKSVAESKFFERWKDSLSGFYEINPPLKKIDLHLPSPTLEDNYSDLKRLERELKKKGVFEVINCEYSALKKLAQACRKDQGKVSVILLVSGKSASIIDIFPQSKIKKPYGLAVDIGTSTIALHLVDLDDGKIQSTASSLNQQITCGEDIISRINYAQNPGRLKKLHELVVSTVNNLISRACQSAQIPFSDIYYASVSGNTTMVHLFLNLEPRYIREEPYIPTFSRLPCILARDLRLKMNPEGRVHCSPAVGSYVGGDITAGILCTPMLRESKKISLFIDIGTNGELVIGNKDWLMTCACSAGPAFEGSGTKCGVPASEGAIEEIKIVEGGKLDYKVIGSAKPKGICGSGLIDLLAELFISGHIDRQGKLNERRASKRIVEAEEGRAFLVEKGKNCFWGKDIVITENDISNLVRTKGAVFSACSVLLKKVGLKFKDIDSVYIAGGFGEHLNIENAVRIGLLPDIDRRRFHYLGNSSLYGAYLILLSDRNKDLAAEVAQKMTYIELNSEPTYMSEYTGSLFLPHTDFRLFPSVQKKLEGKRKISIMSP
jgi:uncharacterized 2Fe-2S/4Fe-4S cluster protein (DUF4445 family)